jgi:microcystin-dependent protein
MSEPFLGQLSLVSFNYAPAGWAMANGQVMQITSNTALFALLGTTFGGNGVQTFALPNLEGRVPVHQGIGFPMGAAGGAESVALNLNHLPSHQHPVTAMATATTADPTGGYLAGGGAPVFAPAAHLEPMNESTVGATGGTQPHENRQPFLVMTWVIALQGIFPSQS